MTDSNSQLQLVSEDYIFELAPADHDHVLRLLNVSSLSLASSLDSERTPDRRASLTSEAQPAIDETSSAPPTNCYHLPRTSSHRNTFRDSELDQKLLLSGRQELSRERRQETSPVEHQQVSPVALQEVSLDQRQELKLSPIEHQEASPIGDNFSLLPDSLSEPSTSLFELLDLLEVPSSPFSQSRLSSPGTPHTSSVYYSTTEETESCAAESPTPGDKVCLDTLPQARPVAGHFATSYQQLIDNCSFDLDQENTVPSLKYPSDNLGDFRLVSENKTPSHTRTSDIDESIFSSPVPTTSIPTSTHNSLEPHPYLSHAEAPSPLRRFAKIRNRLSSIFGERRVTL